MEKERLPKGITDITEAVKWLKSTLLEIKACKCPVCGQTAKLYPRSLSSPLALFMVDLYNLTATNLPEARWVNVSQDMIDKLDHHVSRDYAKLRFWGLLEASELIVGMWRITPAGIAFVEGRLVVPQKAYIYNNHCVRLGKNVTDIKGALGAKFCLKELLGGTHG